MSEFWRGRRVLITGGSGFLGAWLSCRLLAAEARVWSFDLSDGVCLATHGLAERMPVIRGSVLDLSVVERVLRERDVEICFHLAGQSLIEGAAADPLEAFELNIRGTWTVLEACRRALTIHGVVCASSNHAYGIQQTSPFGEDRPLNQLDVYGASKACADILTRAYAHNFGLPAVAVRNVNSFGPGDPHTTHIVTGTILSVLKGESPVIRSDGSPTKAYLHAQDTIEAYALLAEHAGELGVRGEAFNITPAEPVRVIDLVKTIIKVSGKTGIEPIIADTDRSQKDFFEHLAGDKMKQIFGWTPQLTLGEGLRDTYRWYAEHGTAWMGHG